VGFRPAQIAGHVNCPVGTLGLGRIEAARLPVGRCCIVASAAASTPLLLWEPAGSKRKPRTLIEPNAAQAGSGRITLGVAGLDALLERLAAQHIVHEPLETHSNGVRHVKVPDPDGNAIAFAESPNAA
jgi:hypothetical protein